ncbi:hypothetical protein AMTRI_Chr10g225480 [Amborella trichopoda]
MPFLLGEGVARKVHLGFEAANLRYTLPLVGPPSHPTPSNGSLLYTHGLTSILDAIDGTKLLMQLCPHVCPSSNLIFSLSQFFFLNFIPPNGCKFPKLNCN